jgi:hypothetical protein
MAAIYSNGGNRWNILGFNFTKRDALSSVYTIIINGHAPVSRFSKLAPLGDCNGNRHKDSFMQCSLVKIQDLIGYVSEYMLMPSKG